MTGRRCVFPTFLSILLRAHIFFNIEPIAPMTLTLLAALILAAVSVSVSGAPEHDRVTGPLPGFPQQPFQVYSGFLNVSDPTRSSGYDNLIIHYQFDVSSSKNSSSTDPVAVWHTGGPGGSSIYGLYGETGYFQVSSSGTQANTLYSWNQIASMLYLESPAGSFLSPFSQGSGFSYCMSNGVRQEICTWNDVTQAAAYALTLDTFFAQFPEWSKNDLFLVGESYAGQYIPNIATWIQSSGNHPDLKRRLKGIAVGNGCWGGDQNTVLCNGPNEEKNLVDLYHGKGLLSNKLYTKIKKLCAFPTLPFNSPTGPPPHSSACKMVLKDMDKAVGPHNVYNVYDNCPDGGSGAEQLQQWYVNSGKSARWLSKYLHDNVHRMQEAHLELRDMGGGFDWTCGQFEALPAYIGREDVKKMLHLPENSLSSQFDYNSTGPASVTLYPDLIRSGIRVLIYNGDADSCVPYIGNEEWTLGMVEEGIVTERTAWHPWYAGANDSVPAGYATNYDVVVNATTADTSATSTNVKETSLPMFAFVTIRLAGHEVPHYTPRAAYALFKRFIGGKTF